MPPKPKFTREQIVAAALSIVSQNGVEALTAKELGSALGCSASPIFTVFDSMKDIQEDVRTAAMTRFDQFAEETMEGIPLFKQIGMKMVLFAIREPKLYQLLFMQEHSDNISFDDVFGQLGPMAQRCITAIEEDYGLSPADAHTLFETMWIYTYGIGTLCATGVCRFSQEKLGQMLSFQFRATMAMVKGGEGK